MWKDRGCGELYMGISNFKQRTKRETMDQTRGQLGRPKWQGIDIVRES